MAGADARVYRPIRREDTSRLRLRSGRCVGRRIGTETPESGTEQGEAAEEEEGAERRVEAKTQTSRVTQDVPRWHGGHGRHLCATFPPLRHQEPAAGVFLCQLDQSDLRLHSDTLAG